MVSYYNLNCDILVYIIKLGMLSYMNIIIFMILKKLRFNFRFKKLEYIRFDLLIKSRLKLDYKFRFYDFWVILGSELEV